MSVYGSLVQFNSPSLVTATLGKNDPEAGQRWHYAGNEYLFVYNGSGAEITVGKGAFYTGVAGYSVNVSVTSGQELLAGVVYHSTLTTGTYGWLLTRGFGKIVTSASVSLATGLFAAVSTNGFFIEAAQNSGVTSAAQPLRAAKVMVSIDSLTVGSAYISVF